MEKLMKEGRQLRKLSIEFSMEQWHSLLWLLSYHWPSTSTIGSPHITDTSTKAGEGVSYLLRKESAKLRRLQKNGEKEIISQLLVRKSVRDWEFYRLFVTPLYALFSNVNSSLAYSRSGSASKEKWLIQQDTESIRAYTSLTSPEEICQKSLQVAV